MSDPRVLIFKKCREMIKLLNVHLSHFPNHEKYGLSQQIRNTSYEVYCLMVECQKRYHVKTALTNLDITHEKLRMLVHLAFELGYYEYKTNKRVNSEQSALQRFTADNIIINELGKMIGGWIRSLKDSDKGRGL